jgi:hypothetical protein
MARKIELPSLGERVREGSKNDWGTVGSAVDVKNKVRKGGKADAISACHPL